MVVGKVQAASYSIGQAQFGADFLKKTAGEAAAENLVHDR